MAKEIIFEYDVHITEIYKSDNEPKDRDKFEKAVAGLLEDVVKDQGGIPDVKIKNFKIFVIDGETQG